MTIDFKLFRTSSFKQALKNARDARLKTITKADGFGVVYGMKLRGVEIETKVLAPIARVLSR